MKHRRLAVAAIVGVGAIAVFAIFRNWSARIAYDGKSVDDWFELNCRGSLAEREEAREAFQAMGDQAVPFLLSELTRPNYSALGKSHYDKLRSEFPRSLQQVLPRVSTEDTTRGEAHGLVSAIHPSAKALMPRLKPWLSNPKHPRYALALSVLGSVGDGASEGVPFLIQALQSTNRVLRTFAVQSLRNLGPAARSAVPALVAALDDPATRPRAIRALGNIGPDAQEAVPYLERLSEATTLEAPAAAAALYKIDPESNGLRVLIEAGQNPQLSNVVIEELGNLGPAAAPALDTLIRTLRSEARQDRGGFSEWTRIAQAVHRISPTNRTVIPVLLEKLKDAEAAVKRDSGGGVRATNYSGYLAMSAKSDLLNTASWLVRFDPTEAHGLAVLLETLASDPTPGQREFAAYVLRQAGPGASAAIPALKAALKDKDKTVRRAAASALRKIESAKER